jgi:hypothetical protein
LQNPELDQIEASIKSIVKRAYELGRSDTLKKVVDELNARDPSAEQLAFAPQADAEAVPAPDMALPPEEPPAAEAAPAPDPQTQFKPLTRPEKPWWARFGRQ